MSSQIQNAGVRKEYQRWVDTIGPADAYAGKFTIGIHEALQAHFLLADYFSKVGEGIGGIGPKDTNMLHSALARQFVEFGGKPKYSDRIDVCATLMFGLIKNHPFYDANKRTAFLISVLHLQKIGRTPTVSHQEYEDFTVNISDDNLESYSYWSEDNAPAHDREIYVISRFMKRNTRNIDLKSRTITYNELATILSQRGLGLENPKGNRIDLVRYLDSDGDTRTQKAKRIAHIGFHGWSKQVSSKDISIVRDATRLDARHGYDSQSFYSGLDGPLTLIKKYKEPLERLAFR
ncbi:type II toxin-antitoxin system death-on-curing family toxin [uncultured Amaricoccus sp.]|uniref:type II toxin-antitoxin system death-on-curing family toxin n=1 Tax=uncultured Amaricoccus sp. TaxID=339341 RepID=UPI0026329E6A|nr:type II toxin-antitoxin system death-on-curing family toxin [uncultured Amaricoccus sp.]